MANDSARKKARYYYSAAIQEQALNRNDRAFEFFKKAYQADPTYSEAAYAYGTRRLFINIDTLQSNTELERSLSMIRQYVDQYPADLYESLYYGYIAGQLGNAQDAADVLERAIKYHPESTSALLQLSDIYARDNQLGKAVEALDNYEQLTGIDPQISTTKVQYMLAEQDTIGAISEMTRLIDSNPSQSPYYILKGNLFDIIQQPDSAYRYYLKAEELEPESGLPKLSLANYYESIGDSIAYDNKIYEAMLAEDLVLEQKVDFIASYLQTQISEGKNHSRGDHLFSVLQKQYPYEPRVLDLAARYSAAKHDLQTAEEQISYAIDQDPANATYWGQLISYQAAGDNPERAIESYNNALAHITPDDNLKFYYASVAQMLKQFDIAANVYREMILEIEPQLNCDSTVTLSMLRPTIRLNELNKLSDLFTMLGDVYHSSEMKDKSYLAYDNALTLNPDNALTLNNYAYFLSLDGLHLDRALNYSKKALSGDNANNYTYLDTYAWINFLLGNYDKAIESQQKAIDNMKQAGESSPEIFYHLGDILYKTGNNAGAIEAWQNAIKAFKDNEETDDPHYLEVVDKINKAITE